MTALLCAWFSFVTATPTEADEAARAHHLYDFGHYQEAQQKAEALLVRQRLSPALQVDLHELAGLAAFNLGNAQAATLHFEALLRLDPDHLLDPFMVPPSAVRLYENARAHLATQPPPPAPAPAQDSEPSRHAPGPNPAPDSAVAQTARTPHAPFEVTVGVDQLAPFNLLIAHDAKGQLLANRTPFGPRLGVGFLLSDSLYLLGSVAASYMTIYPQAPAAAPLEGVDAWFIEIMVGVRYEVPFRVLSLYVQGDVGSVRSYMRGYSTAAVGAKLDSGPWFPQQGIAANAQGGVDIPIWGHFGVLLSVGIQGQFTVDNVPTLDGVNVPPSKVLWGLAGAASAYARF